MHRRQPISGANNRPELRSGSFSVQMIRGISDKSKTKKLYKSEYESKRHQDIPSVQLQHNYTAGLGRCVWEGGGGGLRANEGTLKCMHATKLQNKSPHKHT